MKKKGQVIGLCRWSYPSNARGFRNAVRDVAENRARLYAAERMEHRLFLFELVVLPSLRRQSDPDFTLILLMGDQLPEPFRSKLLAMIAGVPQIRPVFAAEGRAQRYASRQALNGAREKRVAATAEFRLDDNDAVSVDFVKKTREIFADIRPVYERAGLFGLDFSRGFVLHMHADGCDLRPVATRFWTPGTVIYIRPDDARSVMDFNHLTLWHDMATMIWVDAPMFIRGAHHDNDSNVLDHGPRTRRFEFNEGQADQYLKEHFATDLDGLRESWSRKVDLVLKSA